MPTVESPGDAAIFRDQGVVVSASSAACIARPVALDSGRAYVVRVLAHVPEDTGAPRVEVRDLKAGGQRFAQIQSVGFATSEKEPSQLILPFESPTVSAEIRVCSSAAGALVVHQVELYENLVRNPSFELASGGGSADLPDLPFWMSTTDTEDAYIGVASPKRTGDRALQIDTTGESTAAPFVFSTSAEYTQGRFFAAGGFFRHGTGAGIPVLFSPGSGSLFAAHRPYGTSPNNRLRVTGKAEVRFMHLQGVGRRLRGSWPQRPIEGGGNDRISFGASARGEITIDDAWAIALSSLSVTAGTADWDCGSRESGVARIDGADRARQTTDALSVDSGAFSVTLRHGYPGGLSLAACEPNAPIFVLADAAGNELRLTVGPTGVVLRHVPTSGQTASLVAGDLDLRGDPVELTVTYGSDTFSLSADTGFLASESANAEVFTSAPTALHYAVDPDTGSQSIDAPRCDVEVTCPGASFARTLAELESQ